MRRRRSRRRRQLARVLRWISLPLLVLAMGASMLWMEFLVFHEEAQRAR